MSGFVPTVNSSVDSIHGIQAKNRRSTDHLAVLRRHAFKS